MKILVIDDTSTARRTLTQALNSHAQVKTASTAALAVREMQSTRFDVVIADLRLADTKDDQIGWVERLRAEAPDAQIIINSANDSPEVIERARDLSMERVLKGDYDDIKAKIGFREDRATGLTVAQIEGMIASSELRVAAEREAKIKELFVEMELWNEKRGRPNLEWIRNRKRAFDKSQAVREKIGMGLLGAIAVAAFMFILQLIGSGFQGWIVRKP